MQKNKNFINADADMILVCCTYNPTIMKRPATHYSDEHVISSIIIIRNKKAMLDSMLAQLYGVETKALNQAAKGTLPAFLKILCFGYPRKNGKI